MSTPIIYAAVEPHIILTMDAAQTTDPLSINNNTDYTVFEFEADGHFQNVLTTSVRTGNSDVITVAASNDLTDPIIVASWHFDRTGSDAEDPTHIPNIDPVFSYHGKRDSGVGSCIGGWFQWLGAGSWQARSSTSSNGATYTSVTGSSGEAWLDDDTDIWAFIFYNSDSATTCSMKNVAAYSELVLSEDLEYYRGE